MESLFPSNVRDQLLNQHMNNLGNNNSEKLGKETLNSTQMMGPPIAELYPNTTVLFCDVVDFTKWSSGECNYTLWKQCNSHVMVISHFGIRYDLFQREIRLRCLRYLSHCTVHLMVLRQDEMYLKSKLLGIVMLPVRGINMCIVSFVEILISSLSLDIQLLDYQI